MHFPLEKLVIVIYVILVILSIIFKPLSGNILLTFVFLPPVRESNTIILFGKCSTHSALVQSHCYHFPHKLFLLSEILPIIIRGDAQMSVCPQIWIVLFVYIHMFIFIYEYISIYISVHLKCNEKIEIFAWAFIWLPSELENSSLPQVNASPFLSDKHCQRGKVKEPEGRLFLWPSSHLQH